MQSADDGVVASFEDGDDLAAKLHLASAFVFCNDAGQDGIAGHCLHALAWGDEEVAMGVEFEGCYKTEPLGVGAVFSDDLAGR